MTNLTNSSLYFASCWKKIGPACLSRRNLERLQRAIYGNLDIIRVYSKPPGKEADLSASFVLKRDSTIEEFAVKIHKDFVNKLKASRVWESTAFEGQLVGRDYVLADGDVVELRI